MSQKRVSVVFGRGPLRAYPNPLVTTTHTHLRWKKSGNFAPNSVTRLLTNTMLTITYDPYCRRIAVGYKIHNLVYFRVFFVGWS